MAWGVTFTLSWIVVKLVIIQVWKCWWKIENLTDNSLCVGVWDYCWLFFFKVVGTVSVTGLLLRIDCKFTASVPLLIKVWWNMSWHLYLEDHCGQVWITCIGLSEMLILQTRIDNLFQKLKAMLGFARMSWPNIYIFNLNLFQICYKLSQHCELVTNSHASNKLLILLIKHYINIDLQQIFYTSMYVS